MLKLSLLVIQMNMVARLIHIRYCIFSNFRIFSDYFIRGGEIKVHSKNTSALGTSFGLDKDLF